MGRRMQVVLVVAAATLLLLPNVAQAATTTQTVKRSGYHVTQILSLTYNQGKCNGNRKFQIVSNSIRWTRNSTNRNISRTAMRLVEAGWDCSWNVVTHDLGWDNTTPCWKICTGDPLKSETYTASVSWTQYVQGTGRAGDVALVGGSARGYVVDANGNGLGNICSQINIYGTVECRT
jgi:hypothetical protein